MTTVEVSSLELALVRANPLSSAAPSESSAPASGTAASTSSPTLPDYLRISVNLPGGYRLVSMHWMFDETWNVTVGTLPTMPDSSGISLGYSEYYGSGRNSNPNLALHDAIVMVDWRRANKVGMKQTVLPAAKKRMSPGDLKIELDLSDLDISL